MLGTAVSLLAAGALCLWVSRRRRRHFVESEVRVEPRLMCISCWNICDPQRDFVTIHGEWYCKQCWKIKWEETNA